MYIKFKDGRVHEVSTIHSSYILSTGAEIESITDEMPVLITRENAIKQLLPYLDWSVTFKESEHQEMIKDFLHDLTDYLCHTKQMLTPEGLQAMFSKVIKVQVVYSHLLTDGGTTVYKDKDGTEYYIPHTSYGVKGVYKEILNNHSRRHGKTWDDYRLWDVELEVVEKFPKPVERLMHRDDRPGC